MGYRIPLFMNCYSSKAYLSQAYPANMANTLKLAFCCIGKRDCALKQSSWMQSNVSTWSGYGASFFIKLVLWCGLYGCIECKQQRHACFITKMLCIQSCVQMAVNIIILHVLSCERRSQGVPCSKIVSTMVAAMA